MHVTDDGDLSVESGGTLSIEHGAAFALTGVVRPRGLTMLPERFELQKIFGSRGKPGINADINSATEATREVADPDFEILGTNGTSALSTFNAEGGITITTNTTSGDQMIVLPHLDTNQTAWAQVTWGTDKQVEWETAIQTSADIVGCIIWAGLKLTNTSVVATDNDQVFFRFADGSDAQWQCISSVGGTDTTTDSGVTVAVSTKYHLKIVIDSARLAYFYINGTLVHTTGALTDATDLIPYIGVETTAADAVGINVFGEAISRVWG
jgi:hypothetical protein